VTNIIDPPLTSLGSSRREATGVTDVEVRSQRCHPANGGVDVLAAEPAMAAQCQDARNLAIVGPTVDRFRRDMEIPGRIARADVVRLRCH
jgi:hypothetical protein